MPAKPRAKAVTAKPKSKPSRTMPRFAPAPDWIKEQFAALISHFPEIESRKMFGYPAGFVNGQMTICVFGDRLMLRLSESDRAAFLKQPGTKLFEPMPGRPMREYVEIPPDLMKKETDLRKWIKKGIGYTKTLPLKKGK